MKSRIPADVDRLMWLVAESQDPKAIQDFQTRFPDFSLELNKRRQMVTSLKGAKSSTSAETHIPVFTPTLAHRAAPRGIWLAGGLLFAALAFASYSVTQWTIAPKPNLPPVERVITNPVVPKNETIYQPQKQVQPSEPPAIVQQPPTNPPPPQEMPNDLKLSNTSLIAALKMIGELAGYRVEIAPGFKDQEVSLDYYQVTTSDMLKDLGVRYGFTPFDQGDGTIIIVPAVDNGSSNSGTNNSSRRIG